MAARSQSWSPLFVARLGGILFLISLVAGSFGELYVPTHVLVSTDAAATAKNILSDTWTYRLGFLGYLAEALCDSSLTVVLYLLLKPAGRELALLIVVLRVISTAVFAAAELFYYAPLIILSGSHALSAFSQGQLNALAVLSLRFYGGGALVPTVIYGLAWFLAGVLMWRSDYLPKLLGAVVMIGGACMAGKYIASILVPGSAPDYLMFPVFASMVFTMLWFLLRGVNMRKWEERLSSIAPARLRSA
jgi:hypothetical protein